MLVNFLTGQMLSFVATRDFALNFDDPKVTPSVKIREGQTVLYDGTNASYRKDGVIITGRCSSLKSAINSAQWLIPKILPPEVSEDFSDQMRSADESTDEFSELLQSKDEPNTGEVHSEVKASDFDGVRGGSFDTYATENNDGVFVAPPPGTAKKSNIILEQDIVVKEIGVKREVVEKKSGRLEVAGDQVAVQAVRPIEVNSSTAVIRKQEKRDTKIIRADEMGAEGTIPLKMNKGASTGGPEKKKTFIVDNMTPRTVSDDMTREEVHRITKVVQADDSQDARIVSTIKQEPRVKEVDGITLRKVDSPKEVTLKKVISPTEITVTTKVGSGSTAVEDPTGRTVIQEVAPQEVELEAPDPDAEKNTAEEEAALVVKREAADKKAKERAEARKKSSSATQKMLEGGKKEATPKKPAVKKKAVKKKAVKKKASKKTESPKQNAVPFKVEGLNDTDNYLLMLPEEWGKMHWVKKEMFIKEQTDVGFIKFLLSVETITAVQKACVERLKELEQEAAD